MTISSGRLVPVALAAWLAVIPAVHAFELVSVVAASAPIRLSVLGGYRGNVYSEDTPAAPPVHDPITQRLFVGSVDRDAVDILDIGDPASPRKVGAIDLRPYGLPHGLALHAGLLAVAIRDRDREVQVGRVLLYWTRHGPPRLAAEPISLPTPGAVAFTPDGRRLIALLPGAPNADYSRDPDAGIAVIDPGRADRWACGRSMATGRCGCGPSCGSPAFAASIRGRPS
jgi:hypothetical protein